MSKPLSRRGVVRAGVWAAPVVAMGAVAPQAAASPCNIDLVISGDLYGHDLSCSYINVVDQGGGVVWSFPADGSGGAMGSLPDGTYQLGFASSPTDPAVSDFTPDCSVVGCSWRILSPTSFVLPADCGTVNVSRMLLCE